ncbi:hypothetical protein C8J57DRAFT_1510199 [Mycena rebaudengoi]|nr:hypothetical protein C8J57DRAFT_1510199 [Mycena rebaudengoi]
MVDADDLTTYAPGSRRASRWRSSRPPTRPSLTSSGLHCVTAAVPAGKNDARRAAWPSPARVPVRLRCRAIHVHVLLPPHHPDAPALYASADTLAPLPDATVIELARFERMPAPALHTGSPEFTYEFIQDNSPVTSSSSSHSPIPSTPGSPLSTESSSGDRTIQMSSFMDDSMVPAQIFLASKSLDTVHRTDLRHRIRATFQTPAYGDASYPWSEPSDDYTPAEFLHEGLRTAAAAPWSLTVEGRHACSDAQPRALAPAKRGPLSMVLVFGVLPADDISGPPDTDAGL